MKLSNVSQADFEAYLQEFIDNAFREDIGPGDHTSRATIPHNSKGRAYLLIKESCYLSGIALAEHIFKACDSAIALSPEIADGEWGEAGKVAFYVEGPYRSILTAERLVINCMQHLSGITTKSRHLNSLMPAGAHTRLLDTRKTTPGLRLLEKWAVEAGGGLNHRMGLYDMIMIKDNHIDFAGNITKAIHRVNEYLIQEGLDLPIVVEARNMDEVQEVLDSGKATRVLLDNMTPQEIEEAVQYINQRIQTEASGSIDETNLGDYARAGVDFISTSALTRNIFHKDLSLKFEG